MRAKGMKQLTIWVPDRTSPEYLAEARRLVSHPVSSSACVTYSSRHGAQSGFVMSGFYRTRAGPAAGPYDAARRPPSEGYWIREQDVRPAGSGPQAGAEVVR